MLNSASLLFLLYRVPVGTHFQVLLSRKTSMMSSATGDAKLQSPDVGKNNDVEEHSSVPPTSTGDSAGFPVLDAVGSTEELARVSDANAYGSVQPMPDEIKVSVAWKLEKEEYRLDSASEGSVKNQPTYSVTGGEGICKKKVHFVSAKSGHKKIKSAVRDYDSLLSEFDQFAFNGGGEAVGYGYEIGDMVWGKVKSHPWWPGQIFNEFLASTAVRRSKREGHVLVAFFGDNSYGWFDPAELVPFVESFMEKSCQTSSRAFVKAVEEAVDELSRRTSLGLTCRCRNDFNFWPSNADGYFTVYAGDYEPGVYALSQINKARENFRPKEMLSFVEQLALRPMTSHHLTIEFIKNKATVLMCRKALYEEFDETYAQAFGTVLVRPPRPTAPMVVNPSKAPLSGPLVIAEALGKGKFAIRSNKTKDQMEKEKYLFKRRDEPVDVKPRKISSNVASPLLADGSGLSEIHSGMTGHMPLCSVTGPNVAQHQLAIDQAYFFVDTKSSEDYRKLLEVGKEKKMLKQQAVELRAKHATLVERNKKRKEDMSSMAQVGDVSAVNIKSVVKKKRRKQIRSDASGDTANLLYLAKTYSGAAEHQVSEMVLDVPVSGSINQFSNEKKDVLVASSSSMVEAQPAIEISKLELPVLVRDLHALALDPFHGVEKGCPSITRQVFLKYRSLVYQKSLILSPLTEKETSEAHIGSLPTSAALRGPASKSSDKSSLKRPSARPDDPTKGGKKRIPSDCLEGTKKKKKLVDSKDVYPKKLADSGDMKKKKMMSGSKILSMENKIPQKSVVSQHRVDKEIARKNALTALPRSAKADSSRIEKPVKVRRRTSLMMKFPKGASLPSGAELAAKFARFGPLEYSSTRVYWQTDTCRLVFWYKVDAEAALKFAASSGNLFGYENVKCHVKDAYIEGTEAEPPKVSKEESSVVASSQSRDIAMEQRTSAKIAMQPAVQLKSCLKKQPAEEGGNGNANGNGNGRGTRVKFVLGGDGNPNIEQISNFPVRASSHTHTSYSMDFTSKNVPKLNPLSVVAPVTPQQTPKIPIHMPLSQELRSPTWQPAHTSLVDISGEFLNLLNWCRDVVNNVTGGLGYVPYHSL